MKMHLKTFCCRLSTIRSADKIVALKDGRVAEIGTHDKLMELRGLYFSLVTAQMTDEDKDDLVVNELEEEDNEQAAKQLHRGESVVSTLSDDFGLEKGLSRTGTRLDQGFSTQVLKLNFLPIGHNNKGVCNRSLPLLRMRTL